MTIYHGHPGSTSKYDMICKSLQWLRSDYINTKLPLHGYPFKVKET
jgi:hypothetical protein